ncbi:hypothetical protein ILUMI_10561, partial [Ignelater luminosus]
LLNTLCSHIRAVLYFEESIDTSIFPAAPCEKADCCPTRQILMGDPASTSLWGDYCLTTASTFPFGKRLLMRSASKHLRYTNPKSIAKASHNSVCAIDAPRKLLILLTSNIISFTFLYVIY